MKKLLSFSLILIVLFLGVNLSYGETVYEYNTTFDEIRPIDQISEQPEYDINVTLDDQNINLGESLITLNPYVIIDMNYYIDETLVYTGHKEKLLRKGINRITVKVDRVNEELGDYRELYYWFYFPTTRTEIEVTPTPTEIITNSPSPTPTEIITVEPSNTGNITPTISQEPTIIPSNSPENIIVSNDEIVSSNIVANNKTLPKTGEPKHGFMLISGGFIMLLGTIFLISKIKKQL
jgi:LPXTG-motif cell wall-anchored protein